jgi:hypothetical protein
MVRLVVAICIGAMRKSVVEEPARPRFGALLERLTRGQG